MSYNFQVAESHIRHALGGSLNPLLSRAMVINTAGEYLVSMRPWRWCEDAIAYLDFRKNITVTGCSWTDSTDSITTASNALDGYVFVPGDTFEVTGGTGAYTGYYRIVSVSGGNTLVLDRDISINATPQMENTNHSHAGQDTTPGDLTGISGIVHAEGVALPYDFAELIAYHSTSGLLQGLQMTSHGDLLQKRASAMTMPLGFHYASITQPAKLDGSGEEKSRPYPRLEIWPAPSANENAAVQIVYRRGWASVSNSTEVLAIPSWIEPLYTEIVRAYALGWEESDVATLDQRLAVIAQGPIYAAAIERDSSVQPDLGPLINGAAAIYDTSSPFQNFNTVSAPS